MAIRDLASGISLVQSRLRIATEAFFVITGKAVATDLTVVRSDIAGLLQTNIFSSTEALGPIFKAAYVWLILNVDTMLVALDKMDQRISLPVDDSDDVTEIIRRARYAIVHGSTKTRRESNAIGTSSYIVSVGTPSGYDDDIAVDMGGVRVLIRRHAVRAYEIACAALDD